MHLKIYIYNRANMNMVLPSNFPSLLIHAWIISYISGHTFHVIERMRCQPQVKLIIFTLFEVNVISWTPISRAVFAHVLTTRLWD